MKRLQQNLNVSRRLRESFLYWEKFCHYELEAQGITASVMGAGVAYRDRDKPQDAETSHHEPGKQGFSVLQSHRELRFVTSITNTSAQTSSFITLWKHMEQHNDHTKMPMESKHMYTRVALDSLVEVKTDTGHTVNKDADASSLTREGEMSTECPCRSFWRQAKRSRHGFHNKRGEETHHPMYLQHLHLTHTRISLQK